MPTARDHLLGGRRDDREHPALASERERRARRVALAGGDGTIEAGGDFTKLGGVAQQGFGEFPEISLPTLTEKRRRAADERLAGDRDRLGRDRLGPGLRRVQVRDLHGRRHDLERAPQRPTATVKTVGTTLVRFEALDAYGDTSGWVIDTVTIT